MASPNAKRFDDLKLWIGAEIKRLEDKIEGVRPPITGDAR
jgi:hypothetical protein